MTGEQVLLGAIFAGILILIWLELRQGADRQAIRRATRNLKHKTDELKDATDKLEGD